MATSDNFNTQTSQLSGTDPVIYLLQISHPNVSPDGRICTDTDPITHQGQVFEPLGFNVLIPTRDNSVEKITISMDHVNKYLIPYLDGSELAQFTVKVIMKSTPDVVETEFTMPSEFINIQNQKAEIVLSTEGILERPMMRTLYTPENSAGQFRGI